METTPALRAAMLHGYSKQGEDKDVCALIRDVDEAVRVLEAIRDYEPKEVVKDGFAYDRMVENYRDAARTILGE